MTATNCCGVDPLTGNAIVITFDNRILQAAPAPAPPGVYLAPGFIDLQVNGFTAVDYNHPEAPLDAIARSIRALHSTGVVRFYPTVITGAPADMEACLRNLARAADSLPEGPAIAGFHVEGPHISPEDGPRGAHPRRWVRPPDLDEFRRWQDATANRVRIVTLSPEWPSAPHYIEHIVAEGVVAAIGHTQATAAQIAAAVSAGATLSTHLGNGAHSVLRRHPNYIWDQLAEDRLWADFIVDGIHLDAAFLKVALRAKTLHRAVLITDAVAPAGAPPGRYRIGEQEVDLNAEGRVVLAGQDRLAGSALHMHRGIANLIRLAGLSLADAVRLATVNPARAGAVPLAGTALVPGAPADLVQFRYDPTPPRLEIISTWRDGSQVFP